jgi:hypothetical protein
MSKKLDTETLLDAVDANGAYAAGANAEGVDANGAYAEGAYANGANANGAYANGVDAEGVDAGANAAGANAADVDPETVLNLDADADDADEDILEPEDNMMSSQFKLMSFLNAAMLNQNHGNIYPSASENIYSRFVDDDIGPKDEIKELIENISETNNLIYDETCSITINNEQIKDDISDLKNQFDIFQNEIGILKSSIEEILTNLRNGGAINLNV